MATLPPHSLSVLFRGVVGSLVGQIPYGMLTFGLYETFKSFFLSVLFPAATKLNPPGELQQLLVFVLAAILGDLSGSLWLCPSEVIKQQATMTI